MGLIETYDSAIAALEAQARNQKNGVEVQEANLAFARKRLAELHEHIWALKQPRDALAEIYPPSSTHEQAQDRKP